MKNKSELNIAIIEDDLFYASVLESFIQKHFEADVKIFHCGKGFLNEDITAYDALLLDLNLECENEEAMNGKNILKQIYTVDLQTKVVVLTAQEVIEDAVELLKNGAIDYIVKNEEAFERLQNSIEAIQDFRQITKKIDSGQQSKTKMRKGFRLKVTMVIVIAGISVWMLLR